ncbi:hypothetical protein E2P81_ATG04944 [Venturia nashicola]|uniref:Uncharacterized protein n=1 Tax=Venturia nashicola TaxID=86259 RepID=A0A4Z1PHQ0_9PEZI|nr:hypothetical protein E6O75_ATG05072 [Venturia nashicola]TLD34779.1 hypothetical protein E2P81_ATG04944 [Venturia nashicola]
MDERLRRNERLQHQYKRDLTELYQQAAEFSKALKRDLMRTPWRPRDKQDFELILATVGNPQYNTQLSRRQRPWPLGRLYTPPTMLTIPRELLHMVFAHVFTVPVLLSFKTFIKRMADHHNQARNPDFVIHRFVPDEQGNIIPELLVAADALLGDEDKDTWEEWPTIEMRIIAHKSLLGRYRNKHRMRQIQEHNPRMISAQADKLLDSWPQKPQDIEYCKNQALARFHKKKWNVAKCRFGQAMVRLWDLDDGVVPRVGVALSDIEWIVKMAMEW